MIADAAEPMEEDGALQGVLGFTLVQFARGAAALFKSCHPTRRQYRFNMLYRGKPGTAVPQRRKRLLNHVMVGSNDIERSKRFYDAVLGVLGASEPMRHTADSGHTRLFYRHDGSTFCVSEPIDDEPATFANGSTVAFKCNSPKQVKAFHDVAVARGGTSIEAAPGLRHSTMGPVHLSYVRDPDGNKLCGIYRV